MFLCEKDLMKTVLLAILMCLLNPMRSNTEKYSTEYGNPMRSNTEGRFRIRPHWLNHKNSDRKVRKEKMIKEFTIVIRFLYKTLGILTNSNLEILNWNEN